MSLEMGELFNSTIPSVIVDEVDPDGCRLLGPFAVIVVRFLSPSSHETS